MHIILFYFSFILKKQSVQYNYIVNCYFFLNNQKHLS